MKRDSQLLFIEAIFISAYVRFSLSFLNFKHVYAWHGKVNIENTDELTPQQRAKVRQVYHILKMCGRYAFWKTECYTMALTGKIILSRLGIPSTLYIGFKKQKDKKDKYEGHAWLKTYSGIITGNIDLTEYHVHLYFS